MPFERGHAKVPGSGRKKGQGFLAVRGTVDAILAELNCNPIAEMAKIAADEKNPITLRGRMYAELAQYQHPKRRAVEISGPDGGAIELDVSPAELLESRITSLAASINPPGSPEEPEPGGK